MTAAPKTFQNFGRNLSFSPVHAYAPRDEQELLKILRDHRGQPIRAIGRLHSWSGAPAAEGVLVDMRNFNRVQVEKLDGESWAVVGAGCQIKRLLGELERQGLTMPTLGLITEQSIAGAAATATHGSGRHSISHYLAEVRIAHYNVARRTSHQHDHFGAELTAARCGLGCLGIVVSVRFRCRRAYLLEEHFRNYASLVGVLAAEDEYPLQQAYYLPWCWTYLVQHRRETSASRSWLCVPLIAGIGSLASIWECTRF